MIHWWESVFNKSDSKEQKCLNRGLRLTIQWISSLEDDRSRAAVSQTDLLQHHGTLGPQGPLRQLAAE